MHKPFNYYICESTENHHEKDTVYLYYTIFFISIGVWAQMKTLNPNNTRF